jgi:hypothetical protein
MSAISPKADIRLWASMSAKCQADIGPERREAAVLLKSRLIKQHGVVLQFASLISNAQTETVVRFHHRHFVEFLANLPSDLPFSTKILDHFC